MGNICVIMAKHFSKKKENWVISIHFFFGYFFIMALSEMISMTEHDSNKLLLFQDVLLKQYKNSLLLNEESNPFFVIHEHKLCVPCSQKWDFVSFFAFSKWLKDSKGLGGSVGGGDTRRRDKIRTVAHNKYFYIEGPQVIEWDCR